MHESRPGITHFLEHAAIRNVARTMDGGLYQTLDRYGMEFNASTYSEMVQFYITGATPKFSLGAEWNMMQNTKNVADADLSGMSFYTTVKLAEKVNAFARYDDIWSKNDWNISKDETTYMAGVEIRPCQYVKIAPNFRYHDTKLAGMKDKYYLYISCFFGF
jgi:hypothetical protein